MDQGKHRACSEIAVTSIFVGLTITQAVPLISETTTTTTADGATLPAGESMPGRSGSHCVFLNQQNMLIYAKKYTKNMDLDIYQNMNSSINKNMF